MHKSLDWSSNHVAQLGHGRGLSITGNIHFDSFKSQGTLRQQQMPLPEVKDHRHGPSAVRLWPFDKVASDAIGCKALRQLAHVAKTCTFLHSLELLAHSWKSSWDQPSERTTQETVPNSLACTWCRRLIKVNSFQSFVWVQGLGSGLLSSLGPHS